MRMDNIYGNIVSVLRVSRLMLSELREGTRRVKLPFPDSKKQTPSRKASKSSLPTSSGKYQSNCAQANQNITPEKRKSVGFPFFRFFKNSSPCLVFSVCLYFASKARRINAFCRLLHPSF